MSGRSPPLFARSSHSILSSISHHRLKLIGNGTNVLCVRKGANACGSSHSNVAIELCCRASKVLVNQLQRVYKTDKIKVQTVVFLSYYNEVCSSFRPLELSTGKTAAASSL